MLLMEILIITLNLVLIFQPVSVAYMHSLFLKWITRAPIQYTDVILSV